MFQPSSKFITEIKEDVPFKKVHWWNSLIEFLSLYALVKNCAHMSEQGNVLTGQEILPPLKISSISSACECLSSVRSRTALADAYAAEGGHPRALEILETLSGNRIFLSPNQTVEEKSDLAVVLQSLHAIL